MSEKIKMGILGLGRAGSGMHIPEIKRNLDKYEITAVCDEIKERADAAAKEFGCRAYYDIDSFLADSSFSFADIATRSIDHCEHTIKALEAGKNVIIEKPMALDIAEAERMYAAADRLNKKLYVRHNRRFEGGFNQALEIIDSGILGEVFQVVLTRNDFETRNDWQTLSECGGGQLLNWGPHIVDQALQFGGGYKPESLWYSLRREEASGNCEDHIKIVFTGENNCIIDMEISSACALKRPDYMLYGDRGTAALYPDRVELRYAAPGSEIVKYPSDPGVPGVGGGFGSREGIEWAEPETREAKDVFLDQVWGGVYDDFMGIRPYRITREETLKIMELITRVKAGRAQLPPRTI